MLDLGGKKIAVADGGAGIEPAAFP